MIHLHNHSNFNSKNDLNEAIHAQLSRNKYNLNETTRKVFFMIGGYAVKHLGACQLKAATIASKLGKSTITIRRAINKLVNLGMLKKVSFIRPVSGGCGANIFIVLSPDDNSQMITSGEPKKASAPTVKAQKKRKDTVNSSIQNNYLNNTYSSKNKSFYNRFKNLLKNTIACKQREVSRLFGVYRAQISYLKGAYSQDLLETIGYNALHTALMATKRRKIRNLAGYFSGVLTKMLDSLYNHEIESMERANDSNSSSLVVDNNSKPAALFNSVWADL